MDMGRNMNLETEVNQQCYHFVDFSDDGCSTARCKTIFSRSSFLLQK